MSEPKVRAQRALLDRFTSKHAAVAGPRLFMQGQLTRLTEGAEALHTLFVTRDPTITDGAHIKRTTLAAERLGKETTATINRLSSAFQDGLADLTRRIAAKVHLVPHPDAAEIRAVFRGMNTTERTALLGKLVAEGRGPELAALVKTSGLLTGLSPEHQQRYEAAFISQHAPDEAAEEAALKAAFDDALVSTRVAGEIAAAYANPAKLAEIAAAEKAAAAAASAFNEKVSA
jgi:hypothetical protein